MTVNIYWATEASREKLISTDYLVDQPNEVELFLKEAFDSETFVQNFQNNEQLLKLK